MATQLSLTPNADATVFGFETAVARLRDAVFDHPNLYPTRHSPDYTRKQFRGERDMTLRDFQEMLDKIVRSRGNVGREDIAAIFDEWLGRYGLATAPTESSVGLPKPIEDEILEAQLARARFDLDVQEARTADCDRKRREAKRAASRAIKEIRDVVAHPAMQVTA